MVRALALLLVVGCGYAPGSFRSAGGFPGARETVGCVDIAVHGQRDVLTRNAVMEVNFGNRCDHRIDLDLTSLRMRGRTPAGEVELRPVDPRREIRVAPLDGLVASRELVELHDSSELSTLCVDVARVDRGAPQPPRWTCVEMGGAR